MKARGRGCSCLKPMKLAKRAKATVISVRYFVSRNFFVFCLLLLVSLFFVSCSVSSTITSIDVQLAQVDTLIAVREYDDAWTLLKKIAKDTQNPFDQLGVVRRALLLDQSEYVKTFLKDSIETFPDNEELLAVYIHTLMAEKLYEEALGYAPKLEGGKYGSLYAELRFRVDSLVLEDEAKKAAEGEKVNTIDYYSKDYLQAYVDIANSTGGGAYLRNVALIYALEGDMASAFSYHPKVMSAYDAPLFWAQISYDSLNFVQAVEDLSFFDHSSETTALLADAYLHSGHDEDAKRVWLNSIERYPNENREAWYNIVQSSLREGNMEQANILLFGLVEQFPDYIPGLTAYARFSLLEPLQSPATIFTPLLKDQGIQTLQMERDATIRQVNPFDALYRIEESLARLQAKNSPDSMYLILEDTKLRWDSSIPPVSTRQRLIDVWALLEEHVQEPFGYDPLLVQYAVWYFCTQGMIDEANGLFTAHYATRYLSSVEDEAVTAEKSPFAGMENWEYEFGGYIALQQKRYADAEAWLRFFVDEGAFRYATPISAALNLTSLYNGSGRRTEALGMYRDALRLTSDKLLQADIYYRMALIQHEIKETRSAKLSLNQCLSLDSSHNQARLLLKQIDALR